jgi:hypothetical protein
MNGLEKIFRSQAMLNNKLCPTLQEELQCEYGQVKWILNYKLAMDQKIAEMGDSLPWKWWKKQELEGNEDNRRIT